MARRSARRCGSGDIRDVTLSCCACARAAAPRRGSARQHATVRLLRAGGVRVDPLSEDVAYRLGLLLAKSGTSDVVDAHVALLARRLHAIVLSSDPDDLTALDPSLTIVTV